jgi:hypothetical protein
VELLKRAGFKKVTLRGDTNFSQTKYLDAWNRDKVNFVFGYDASAKLGAREIIRHSCPLDNLHSNWAYMVMTTLSWNLTRWFALLLPETGRWKKKHAQQKHTVLRMSYNTFLRSFMLIPTQVLSSGRRLKLRLLS